MRTMEHAAKTRAPAPEFASKRLATANDSTLATTARWTLPTLVCRRKQHSHSTRWQPASALQWAHSFQEYTIKTEESF